MIVFARSILPALLPACIMVLVTATPIEAHALVERSDPPAYRLLLRPPDRIVLYFSEPIDARRTAIKVLDQEGRRVDEQGFLLSPDRRQARLPVRLPEPGIYTVTWRTLSLVDQHTYEGFFTFTAGPLRPGAFTLQAGVPRGPTPWEVAARWLMFLGAAVLGGGFLIHRFLLPSALTPKFLQPGHDWSMVLNRRWHIAARLGAAGFFVGSIGDVTTQAARAATAAGVSLGTTLVQLAADEPMRTSLLLKFAIPVALLILLRHRAWGRPLQPVTGLAVSAFPQGAGALAELALLALLPLGISLTSHAAGSEATLALLADWVHLASAAAWVGGLIYFGAILAPSLARMEERDRIELLSAFTRRFSTFALVSVAILVATGLYASWINVPSLRAVSRTAYGRTLAVKMALFLPLLSIAAVNLLVMRPRLAAAARQALEMLRALALHRRFFRLVRSEVTLASVVLLAAAALALTPTARQAEALSPTGRPFEFLRQAGGLAVFLRIDPYQVGANTFAVRLRQQDGRPVPEARVRFTFLPLFARLGTATAEAEPQGDGRFLLTGGYIGTRGPWVITVTVRMRGAEDLKFIYAVEPDWERGTQITPATDPQAATLLRAADGAMNRLRSVRQRQEITDGFGNEAITDFEFAAPNRMHYRVAGGLEAINVGDAQFMNDRGIWRRIQFSDPFRFPNFTYTQKASSVVFGPREIVDGLQTQAIVFILNIGAASARYVVWVDEQSRRIVREAMVAPSHYMIVRYYDFNAPVRIEAPDAR